MEPKETKDALNSLIIINNDRYEGYKKAAEETKDENLKNLFLRLSSQSDSFGKELRALLPANEQAAPEETTASGKIYRMWMDLKAALAGNDRKAILESCEFGEDAALKTYEEALNSPKNLTSQALTIIKKQQSELLQEHNKIKTLRDREKEKVS